jgi:hypothetical protein
MIGIIINLSESTSENNGVNVDGEIWKEFVPISPDYSFWGKKNKKQKTKNKKQKTKIKKNAQKRKVCRLFDKLFNSLEYWLPVPISSCT